MAKKRFALFACLLGLGVATGFGSVRGSAATEAATVEGAAVVAAADAPEGAVPNCGDADVESQDIVQSSQDVVESQDAVDCYAGGWQPVVSGWPGGRCCGTSVRRWLKYAGGTTYNYKCCGACPQ